MVWGTVGLLDDAIREHLEFKRRHGADPSDVARLEGEVFGSLWEVGSDEFEASPIGEERDALGGVGASSEADLSHTSQETAELDMRTVLEAEPMESAVRARPPVESPGSEGGAVGDPLDWELPGERYFSERLRDERSDQGSRDRTQQVLAGAPEALFDAPSQERPLLAKRFVQ